MSAGQALRHLLRELPSGRRLSLVRGETLCGSWKPPRFYYVVSGAVGLSLLGPGGSKITAVVVGPGRTLGEGACGETGQLHEAQSLAPGSAVCWRWLDLRQVLERPRVRAALLQLVEEKQTAVTTRLLDLLQLSVYQRTQALLEALARHYGQKTDAGHRIPFRLTQYELAAMVAASRPSLARALKRMKNQRSLWRDERGRLVVDAERLSGSAGRAATVMRTGQRETARRLREAALRPAGRGESR